MKNLNFILKILLLPFLLFMFMSNANAADQCSGATQIQLNSSNTSGTISGSVNWNNSNDDLIYFNFAESGTLDVWFSSNEGDDVRFADSANNCPDGNDHENRSSRSYTPTSYATDFNIRIYRHSGSWWKSYTFNWSFTPDAPTTCINSASPFSSLADASSVTTAGIYCFDLSGTAFRTYVDATGYMLTAIDFGNGTGTLPGTDALTDTSRGILNSTILSKLTETGIIRISSSNSQIDVTTTNATLISRVLNKETLKRGQSDNTINNGWTGTNAARITTNATCDKSATGLDNRIIHQCGDGQGFHWVPEENHQRINWSDGDVSNSVSFRLWVKTASTTSADLNISKPTPPSPLTANINEDIHFQPHLENLGPDTASADITLSILYSLDVTVGSVPTGYTCTVSSGALSAGTANVCTSTSDIANGSAQDFLFTVQATEGGSLTQAVTVSSATNDPDATNNFIISDAVTIGGFLAVADSFSTPANIPLDENVFTNDIGIVSGVTISNVDTSSLQGSIISIDINTGEFTYDPPLDFSGSTSFSYTISDGTLTSTATVTISVSTIPINAVDDTFDTYPDVTLRGNILQNDEGLGITYTDMITAPSHGTITVQSNGDFIYTPSGGYRGNDTFVYEITDIGGYTDTATVTITIGTSFTSGDSTAFQIVNPDFARNVIGDYKIAGNTVLCLTEETDEYGGTCHGHSDYQDITSNMHMSQYLDIDSDVGTWNSTSSYIDLSGTAYDPTRGVIWAGLFWGGRVVSEDNHPIRYYTENYPSAPTAVEIGEDGTSVNIDVSTIGTQNIKLKIDNGSYNNVISSTFHTSGQTYSAYADVSSVLQAVSLNKGKHVFTVANLTTMEGREDSPGAFGGWALVVVYAEDHTDGKARNISIYNGFIDIEEDDDPITISGFKLPASGDVLAQLSVFSGEGEHLYGYRADHHDSHDWMKISNDDNNYSYMPGLSEGDHVGNQNNSFNAQLDNILRDHIDGEYNDLAVNNVGVDIDNYDVSNLMTFYRDADQNISEVKIKTSSDWDYITMSMVAFSAELYVPELCYDYTLDIDGHVIPSVNNEIKTPFGDFGKPLTNVLYLKSLEGDIDLTNVNVNYSIGNTAQVTYNECPGSITYVSETGEYDYTDACDYVHSSGINGFEMYIGKNKTTSQGGTISAFENRYIKFKSDLKTATISTDFSFSVDYTVDYGSGAVPLTQIFTADDLCDPTSAGFLPELGTFNITDITNNYDKWNLYTQVSRRPFDLKLYAYAFDANDYLTPITDDLNLSVEVEIIRADNFNRDANTACNDEHSIMAYVPAKFLNFDADGDGKSVEFGYTADELDFAYRSAAMRVWYLTDVDGNGTLADNHNCTRDTQSECVDLYMDQYSQDTICSAKCSLTNTSLGNCYDCLRTNYGRKVCSRDNFAIRPESFVTQIYDSNQSNLIKDPDPSNHIANSVATASEFSLVSGYDYRFDINSTSHVNNIATPRYIQHFEPGSPTHYIHMNWYPNGHTVSGCNDVADKNISLNIFNGSNVNPITDITYVDKVDQIGKYRFEVYDQNWTSADWNEDEMLHHFGDYAAYYKPDNSDHTPDCIKDDSIVEAIGTNSRQGCIISSVHTNSDTGEEYKYLYAQYYPYEFDISGLGFGARPSNDSSNNALLYINTPDLNVYPNGVDENMSYNIQGTFAAVGKDGGRLSNFVEDCYAESVDMSLYQNYNHAVPTLTPYLTYDLIDYNTTDHSHIIRARENSTFGQTNIETSSPIVPLVIDQGQEYFERDMNGSLTMDLGYNYVRAMDTELNPRHMYMRDFNTTYTTPPANIFADLNTDHKIFGNVNMDQNVTFVYARAKPGQYFYDDVTANSVLTPVSVLVFCGDLGPGNKLSPKNCQDRGVPLMGAQTNEAYWWKSINHDNVTNMDGNIVLSIPAVGSFSAGSTQTISANITSGGTDSTIQVFNKSGSTPITIPITFIEAPTVPYTDRWLIYNPYSTTVAPSPFYKVRFIGNSVWTGVGKTGNVVGTGTGTQKSKRLDW